MRNNCPEGIGFGQWNFNGVPFTKDGEGSQYRIQTCQGGNGCCAGMPQAEVKPE